jgi:pyruvate dehydrogenase E1 component alpha subunit
MIWKLPVIFFCENNGYAMGTSVERSANHTDIWKLGLSYEMPCSPIDGMDPVAVSEAVKEAVDRARKGEGPTFLEMKTYRYKGHSMSDAQKYRTKDEIAEYQKIDPITKVLEHIKKKKWATDEEIDAILDKIKATVKEAVDFAEESPFPSNEALYKNVYVEEYPFIKE